MKVKKKSEFYTPKGYRMIDSISITESMEDYIEMICRIAQEEGFARISDLSGRLNVMPSSASKMVNKLEGAGLVVFPKYGVIQLSEEGKRMGCYLIWRHKTLENFLCLINESDNETKEVEQIEHFINEQTAKNIEKVTEHLKSVHWGTFE